MTSLTNLSLWVLLVGFCLYGNAQQSDSLVLEDIQTMIAKAEANMDQRMALASIGEAQLEEGLWLPNEDHRFGGELLAFEGVPVEDGIELRWTTASEFNSMYFAVERQQKDGEFASINMQKAAGYARSLRSYFFVDRFGEKGPQTYRLRQVDQSGTFHYCQPIVVQVQGQQFMVLKPSTDLEQLDIQTDIKMVRISITDQTGTVVVRTKQETESFTRIDIADLKPGTYAVKVEDGDQVRMMQFHKKK